MAEDKSILQQIGDSITEYAPKLGAVLAPFTGGATAVIGTAIGALGTAFGLGDKPNTDELAKAIATDPQAALKLKLADQDFSLQMAKLDFDRFKASIESIKTAQTRQIEHEKITGKSDVNLYALAWTIVAGFLGLVIFLLYIPVPQDQSGVVFMLFGALATGFGQVLNFFFGSSASSENKTRLLAKAQPVE